MSYAWKQLRLAVRALTGAGSQRERLIKAYTHLITLKQKDLPAEVRADFAKLTRNISRNRGSAFSREARSEVELLSDNGMVSVIHSIIDMYDAVTRYQPLRSLEPKELADGCSTLASLSGDDPHPSQLPLFMHHAEESRAPPLTLVVNNSANSMG